MHIFLSVAFQTLVNPIFLHLFFYVLFLLLVPFNSAILNQCIMGEYLYFFPKNLLVPAPTHIFPDMAPKLAVILLMNTSHWYLGSQFLFFISSYICKPYQFPTPFTSTAISVYSGCNAHFLFKYLAFSVYDITYFTCKKMLNCIS